MLRFATNKMASLCFRPTASFAAGEGAEFLEMVEKYFDKAGKYTKIRPDLLNFYKKADNVVKFNLTLIRGNCCFIQTTKASKSFQLTDVNIRHTSSPPKEEPGMPKTSISQRSKPWLVS